MQKGNRDNLRVPSSVEARKNGEKGGRASGKVRQEKKRLKEALLLALKSGYDIDGKTVTGYKAATISLIKRVISTGDPAAFNAIRDLIGEKPVDKQEIDLNDKRKLEDWLKDDNNVK